MSTSIIPNGPDGANAILMKSGWTSTSSDTFPVFGWITSSATELYIFVYPMYRPTFIHAINVSFLTTTCYFKNGNYLGGSLDYDVYSNSSSIGVSFGQARGGGIYINCKKKNNGTWGTNNQFFAGTAKIAFTAS